MTPEQINRKCAELDGVHVVGANNAPTWALFDAGDNRITEWCNSPDEAWSALRPDYTTSYDAIIPLIQKQLPEIVADVIEYFPMLIKATPLQLCEALLRAVGKWEEDGLSPR